MLSRHLKRRPNITPALGRCIVFDWSVSSGLVNLCSPGAAVVAQGSMFLLSPADCFVNPRILGQPDDDRVDMRRWFSVGLQLGHRRRQRANSKPTLDQRLTFAREGPGRVVKAAWLVNRKSRVRAHSGLQVSKKNMFLPRWLVKI